MKEVVRTYEIGATASLGCRLLLLLFDSLPISWFKVGLSDPYETEIFSIIQVL